MTGNWVCVGLQHKKKKKKKFLKIKIHSIALLEIWGLHLYYLQSKENEGKKEEIAVVTVRAPQKCVAEIKWILSEGTPCIRVIKCNRQYN